MAKKTVPVPVKLARRCGLDGYSTTVAGGLFSLDLHTLRSNAAAALGRSVELECLWLSSSGLDAFEASWGQAHYPEMGW